jgi:DNA damage-binding protein 1
MSFIGSTIIYGIDNDNQLSEIEENEFELKSKTLFCSNIFSNFILQITNKSILIINSINLKVIKKWNVKENFKTKNDEEINIIQLACSKKNKILVSISGGHLLIFEINKKDENDEVDLVLKNQKLLENEISCINFINNDYCCIGLWNEISINIIEIKSLEIKNKEKLNEESLPRSLLYTKFYDNYYLFCGMSDGNLIYFKIDINNLKLYENKKVSLGTKPILLSKLKLKGITNIFVVI